MEESVIRNVEVKDDGILDNSIRPEVLDEYIGQTEVKENIKVFIEAAKMRKEALRSCFTIWSSWTWKNYSCLYNC